MKGAPSHISTTKQGTQKKKSTNLRNSPQTKGAGGNSAALVATTSNTAGTPIHQDAAALSVRTHQMSENRNPRDMMVDQLILTLTDVIRQHFRVKSAQPRIHSYYSFSTTRNEMSHL